MTSTGSPAHSSSVRAVSVLVMNRENAAAIETKHIARDAAQSPGVQLLAFAATVG